MSFFPMSFAKQQELRAAARLALLGDQEYWSNLDSSPAPPTLTRQTAPSNIVDPQLGLLRRGLGSQQVLPPSQLHPPASDVPVHSMYPHQPDSILYLNQATLSHLGTSTLTVPRTPMPSFQPSLTSLSASTLSRMGLPQQQQYKRGLHDAIENESEATTILPVAKRQRFSETSSSITSTARMSTARPHFPHKLMEAMVLYNSNQHQAFHQSEPAFKWLHHGTCFIILNEDAFMAKVLFSMGLCDRYYKFSSFIRKLTRWGFSRHAEPLGQCFRNALFREGNFELCATMKCKPVAKPKAAGKVTGQKEQESQETKTAPKENKEISAPVKGDLE